jgi:hypothetical protein
VEAKPLREERAEAPSAEVAVLVNQVGYDTRGPKRLVLQCRRKPRKPPHRFSILEEGTGQLLYAGGWEAFGRVNAGTPDDWGFWYWRGEASDFERAGRFLVETEVDGTAYRSPVFAVGPDLLWKRLAPLLVEYFRRSRNTRPHGVLEGEERHYDVSGGWFELGDHGGTLMRDAWKVLWSLIQARERDPFLESAREEMLYGSTWWKHIMLHYPRSGRIISGMGGWLADAGRLAWHDYPCGEQQHEKLLSLALYLMLYRYLHDSGFLKRADKMWSFYSDWLTTDRIFSTYYESASAKAAAARPGAQPAAEQAQQCRSSWPTPGRNFTLVDDAALLFGVVEMLRELKRRTYLEYAQDIIDRLLAEAQDPEARRLQWNNFADHLHATSLAYFAAQRPDDPHTELISRHLEEVFDGLVRQAESASPFAIARKHFAGCEAWRPDGRLADVPVGFFNRQPEGTGLNLEYGMEAWQMLWVNRVVAKPEYRRFALAHIDWVLGLNPRSLCMVKGVGSGAPPFTPGNVPDGAVCYGLVSDGSRDRPWLGDWPATPRGSAQTAESVGGHEPWAQSEARLGSAAALLLALSMT